MEEEVIARIAIQAEMPANDKGDSVGLGLFDSPIIFGARPVQIFVAPLMQKATSLFGRILARSDEDSTTTRSATSARAARNKVNILQTDPRLHDRFTKNRQNPGGITRSHDHPRQIRPLGLRNIKDKNWLENREGMSARVWVIRCVGLIAFFILLPDNRDRSQNHDPPLTRTHTPPQPVPSPDPGKPRHHRPLRQSQHKIPERIPMEPGTAFQITLKILRTTPTHLIGKLTNMTLQSIPRLTNPTRPIMKKGTRTSTLTTNLPPLRRQTRNTRRTKTPYQPIFSIHTYHIKHLRNQTLPRGRFLSHPKEISPTTTDHEKPIRNQKEPNTSTITKKIEQKMDGKRDNNRREKPRNPNTPRSPKISTRKPKKNTIQSNPKKHHKNPSQAEYKTTPDPNRHHTQTDQRIQI